MDQPHPTEETPESDQELESEVNLSQSTPAFTVMNGVQTVISIALVMATLLTLWNPRKVFSTPSLSTLLVMEATQAAVEVDAMDENVVRIGVLAGHWQNTPGEVCSDGLIEADVNYDIAKRVVALLEESGYAADLFPEFDLGFLNYEGAAFITLYTGSCTDSPPPPSGFKVGGSLTAQNPQVVDALATCISSEYQKVTNLPFAYQVINPDNSSYHIFRDINPSTPAILLEMGSLKTDRQILTRQANKAAEGIVEGLLCFLHSQQ